jgi:hypothetical protein
MKRYVVLLIALIVVAVAVGLVKRSQHGATAPAAPAVATLTALDLTITPDAHLEPATMTVKKDTHIALSVTNHYHRAMSLTLMGYQDRFRVMQVAPDSTWRGTFIADRPGEDFAWVLEGAPAGRLVVTGSHLIEDHR